MLYKVYEKYRPVLGDYIEMTGFEIAVTIYDKGHIGFITIGDAINCEDEFSTFCCPVCGGTSTIRHSTLKDPCFVSRCHNPSCQLYLSHSKHKRTNNIVIDANIDLSKAIKPSKQITRQAKKYLDFKNGTISIIKHNSSIALEDAIEEDQSQQEIIKTYTSIRRIHSNLKDRDADHIVYDGITKREFYLDRIGEHYARKNGIPENAPRLAITERIKPYTLEYPFSFDDDYILLRNRFASTNKSSLFFLVRIIDEFGHTHQLENKVFQYYVTGNSHGDQYLKQIPKDTHDTILIMGDKWHKLDHEVYTIYAADIFADDRDFINWGTK